MEQSKNSSVTLTYPSLREALSGEFNPQLWLDRLAYRRQFAPPDPVLLPSTQHKYNGPTLSYVCRQCCGLALLTCAPDHSKVLVTYIPMKESHPEELQKYQYPAPQMCNPKDMVCPPLDGAPVIKIVIHWPGYPAFNSEVIVNVYDLNMQDLACFVSSYVDHYLKDIISRHSNYRPDDTTWQIGKEYIHSGNVILMGIQQLSASIWTVDLCTTYDVLSQD
ncbi:uncharacterized protein FOMMEDRAFT_158987 [Fomitiporia mediterranea MF3/22]|uniref:uncharacterized protein n=1 Tax=Fomitiporia mediterranea (strain MF3/22) TaxID=694068 RepID=UPI0004408AF4|nr:uncharacterized protein FOMMEDRAFT_158987 [Fomitiporia mediterranea MF3/22]EJD00315.1 hypothetical protein FOMMEDRAFT_158987 [Fomitiporia mediterranea MF3/22]